ncbi:CD225/dispanin family protein [Ornithobacterium rhinotracheale]|uniref:CD225/dispanin family protein n=1 Tax=Ornithobacterium rhinotracheale TaxID=28251 RepID=UPI003FA4931B
MEEINKNFNPPPKENYLTLAIVASVLGVLTCGVFGLLIGFTASFFAMRYNKAYKAAQYAEAYRYKRISRVLSFGLIILSVFLMIMVAYVYKFHPELFQQALDEINQKMQQQNQ